MCIARSLHRAHSSLSDASVVAVFPEQPDLTVSFDFGYSITLPASQVDGKIVTVASKAKALLLSPVTLARAAARALSSRHRSADSLRCRSISILSACKGRLEPGSLTLLLATPGHGKSSLLKALAGHLPPSVLSGSIRYNGLDQRELAAAGVKLKLLASYIDQLDIHLPFLTVRETVTFAHENSTVEPSVLGDPLLERAARERVDRILKLLNLEGCADTLVGSNLVRGVSGGEKKRVTIAEALVSNARLICADEVSTGLDASVAFDIVASMRVWATETRGTVVMALLQATPEVYNLFSDVLMLREGAVVYLGPRQALPGYLRSLGFRPPAVVAKDGGPELADWLMALLASPTKALRQDEAPLDGAPRTTAALVEAWGRSELRAAQLKEDEDAAKPQRMELRSEFARRQFGEKYPRSGMSHFRALLIRSGKVTLRNKLFITARVMSSVVISVILGTVWYKLSDSEALQKFGMLLFAVLQTSFANFVRAPTGRSGVLQ